VAVSFRCGTATEIELEGYCDRDFGRPDFVCGDFGNERAAGGGSGAECGAAAVDFGAALREARIGCEAKRFLLKALYKPLRPD
jgi:hypothetical protein